MPTLVPGRFKAVKGEDVNCEWEKRQGREGDVHLSPVTPSPSLIADHSSPGKLKNRGFTLIEMLVVMLIMGILVGMVSTLAQPDDKSLLRVEVERLVQLMNIAETESRLTGKSIAWTADGKGYRFWRFSEDEAWVEIVDDDLLRARTLPKGMAISNLRVENMRSPEHMRVEFNAYGSSLSFSVEMSIGDAHFTLLNSPIGDVRVLPEGGEIDDKDKLAQH